jgi:hypothetical protein
MESIITALEAKHGMEVVEMRFLSLTQPLTVSDINAVSDEIVECIKTAKQTDLSQLMA